MRIAIHVRPKASVAAVGGSHDDALVVKVREAASGGRATKAALDALAAALDVPRRGVTLVSGAKTRRKVVDVATEDEVRLQAQLDRLWGGM